MEKIKKFEDFLDRMQGLLDNAKRQGHILVRVEDLENTFPELKESREDEMIRVIKEVILNSVPYKINILTKDTTITAEEAIAWLEKQGKHANFRNKIQIGDKVTKNDNGELVNLSQLERVAKKLEKPGEQNPADKVEQKGMNIVEEDMTPFQKKVFCIIDTAIEEEQGLKQVCDELLRLAHDEIKQKPVELGHSEVTKKGDQELSNVVEEAKETMYSKPAWSEEDEEMLRRCISSTFDHGYLRECDWLKSIKDRFGCEVNCTTTKAWSEEDEAHFDSILKRLEGMCKPWATYTATRCSISEDKDWLKSLKDRVGNFDDGYKVGFSAAKHNQWKPSDEQMKALDNYIYAKYPDIKMYGAAVKSLYQDLMKLK